jgi:hypothetical protein
VRSLQTGPTGIRVNKSFVLRVYDVLGQCFPHGKWEGHNALNNEMTASTGMLSECRILPRRYFCRIGHEKVDGVHLKTGFICRPV